MNEINPADAAFVKKVVEGQMQVSDITKNIKVNVPANGKRKGKKRMLLKDFVASYTGDMHNVYMQARAMRYEDNSATDMFVTGWDSMQSQERHRRQGGAFASLPPNDPKAALDQARRRADEMALRKETVELELRGLRHEENVCRTTLNSKDAEAAALAEITLKKLLERRIPDVLVTLRKAKDDEDMALKALRAARGDVPKLGGLQHVKYGSAEEVR